MISAVGGYSSANVFGKGDVPTFQGPLYGGEIEYVIGSTGLAVAPFAMLRFVDNENSFSDGGQTESLRGNYQGVGIKAYSNSMYLRLGLGQGKLKNKTTQAPLIDKELEGDFFELGGGLGWPITSLMSLTLGIDITHFKFDKAKNNLQDRLDYTGYSAVLGITFLVPSSSRK
jgi:hypothetical protein